MEGRAHAAAGAKGAPPRQFVLGWWAPLPIRPSSELLMRLTHIKRDQGEEDVLDACFGRIDMIAEELECNALKGPDLYILMVSLNGLSSDYDTMRAIIESTEGIDTAKARKMLRN